MPKWPALQAFNARRKTVPGVAACAVLRCPDARTARPRRTALHARWSRCSAGRAATPEMVRTAGAGTGRAPQGTRAISIPPGAARGFGVVGTWPRSAGTFVRAQAFNAAIRGAWPGCADGCVAIPGEEREGSNSSKIADAVPPDVQLRSATLNPAEPRPREEPLTGRRDPCGNRDDATRWPGRTGMGEAAWSKTHGNRRHALARDGRCPDQCLRSGNIVVRAKVATNAKSRSRGGDRHSNACPRCRGGRFAGLQAEPKRGAFRPEPAVPPVLPAVAATAETAPPNRFSLTPPP